MLAVKENQGRLYDDVSDLFEGAEEAGFDGVPHDYATTLNKGHGRIERRECWSVSDPACLEYLSTGKDWPGLRSVVKVVGRRETETGATVQSKYYINSLAAPAEQLLGAARAHWSIENSLHWSLDVTFREDQCRMRLARESGYLKKRGMRVALDTTNILGRGAVKDTFNLLADGMSSCCGRWHPWSGPV